MKYLIIGGTGSLAQAILKRLKSTDISIMSREEIKQKKIKNQFTYLSCHLGDVKVYDDVERVISRVKPNVVFHLAAQKHVEIAEENPEECIAVNLIGTQNVARACLSHDVDHMIFSSTDKAVLPINIYGKCKAVSESLLFELNRLSKTKFSVFRWGNVAGSRGSVIHEFVRTLKEEKTVYITDASMSRFWIHLDDVALFMIGGYKDAPQNRPMIPPMKAANILELASATARHLKISEFTVITTGIRRGEKYHEVLISEHEKDGGCLRSDTCEQYTSDELAALVKRVLS